MYNLCIFFEVGHNPCINCLSSLILFGFNFETNYTLFIFIMHLFFILGLDCDIIYPQGLSCTLPEDLQLKMLQYIPGLQDVVMIKPG